MKISSLGWVFVLIFISITIVSSAQAPPPPKPKPAPAPKPKPAPAPTPAPKPKPAPKPAPGGEVAPPCSENVIWSISKEIRTVSSKQVKLLRVAVHDASDSNARPLQAINKRMVYLYKPKVKLMKKYRNTSFY
ncbi:Alpha carbonic anhydrase domain [Arabidopsis thaliana x Arabidopsis arenosa]|uniref:Alpha carbonic anhydrase domain n=1 Tax=Arabidopsis thaliana x Arabidopsis arenosa TaxID=1240361 RepID=A0A8T1XJJ2_9BRAS|nr:Alpha carbonic anhydrase domain [Arabidopsis thaliana x Arabidopsis arenosa]